MQYSERQTYVVLVIMEQDGPRGVILVSPTTQNRPETGRISLKCHTAKTRMGIEQSELFRTVPKDGCLLREQGVASEWATGSGAILVP